MAIALSKEKVQANHSIMVIVTFATLFIVNNLVLHLANMLFPAQIVLGTNSISHWWAMYHSMFKLSVIGTLVVQVITYCEWKNKITFTSKQWMMSYLLVNFVALWEISRFADNLGLGMSSWFVVLLLAIVLDVFQGMGMMFVGEKAKKLLK